MMRNKAIVREISEDVILVEPLNSDSPHDGSYCSSGGCGSCSHKGKRRLMKASNPGELPLSIGRMVELEVPSLAVAIAALKILIAPPGLFLVLFFLSIGILKTNVLTGVAMGLSGLAAAALVIFIFRKKSTAGETPEIVALL